MTARRKAGTIKGTQQILAVEDFLANAIEAWFDEMLKLYVNQPNSDESRQVVMRGFGIAVRNIAEKSPNSQQLINSLINSLTA